MSVHIKIGRLAIMPDATPEQASEFARFVRKTVPANAIVVVDNAAYTHVITAVPPNDAAEWLAHERLNDLTATYRRNLLT